MQELRAALRALDQGCAAALIFVIEVGGSTPRSAGARMTVLEDGRQFGTIGGGEVEHRVVMLALECLRTGRPTQFDAHLTRDLGMCCGGKMSVYIEPLIPPPTLFVFGAGHVAHATVPIAQSLGFEVTVIDDRDEWNHPGRFSCPLHTGDPVAYARDLPAHSNRYALILTHNHDLDLDLCQLLLPLQLSWLGMIGSRAKAVKFRVRLEAAGLSSDTIARLHSPVGLRLGAETPAEIAVSIAAELVQHLRQHPGPAELMSTL